MVALLQQIRNNTADEIGRIFEPYLKKCTSCKTSCCKECKERNGYFIGQHLQLTKKEKTKLNYLKKKYNFTKNGFFNKKCSLPRNMRSKICVEYICNNKMNKKEKQLINTLSNIYEQAKQGLNELV